jgi:hypothetical protein
MRRGVGFDWNKGCAGHRNREPRRNVGVRRDDHFVARSNTQRSKRQCKRFQPVGDANAVRGFAISREFGLELLDRRPADVPARRQQPLDRLVDLGREFLIGW